MPSQVLQEIISINGTRLWTARQGQGPPLVLCHGGPGAYDCLEPLAAMVDDLCTVLRYDQRGGGRSAAEGPFAVATFVADLEGLRRHFGWEQWLVGGESWGAALALTYAVTYPRRTRALLYLSGTGIDPRWHEAYRRNRLAPLSPAEQVEFRQLSARRATAIGKERERIQRRRQALAQRANAHDPARLSDLPTYDEHPTSSEVNQQVSADWAALYPRPDFQKKVDGLAMPALFLHGEGDPRPARFVAALAGRLARGEYQAVPRAGHYPWIEQPNVVRRRLRSFLQSIVTAELHPKDLP